MKTPEEWLKIYIEKTIELQLGEEDMKQFLINFIEQIQRDASE